jgi:Domain of unknown function (DUF4815)
MALDTNFNVNPYYDDFDEDKKFLRVLFKPGYAVQARELTQLQTILQKQSDRFGSAAYKNGSVVTGAETFTQDATYIKLNASYLGTDIVANNFIGMTILSNDESKRAEVIKVYPADLATGDPITLMVKQLYGNTFASSDVIKTNETSPYYAQISTGGVGTGQIFSVTEGIFYYEGFFIKTNKQTIATSKYDNITTNAKIGFEIEESLISSSTDTSLLDPAQDASNYQAPGADRYKIELVLATRALDSTDTKKFIEISRTVNGYSTRTADTGVAAIIEDELARRTYDESGNYTVRPFILSLQTNAANSANMDIILSPGKAYVYGYEYGTSSPTTITIDKPRTTSNVNNKRITGDYGNFIYTTGHIGSWPINHLATVDLHTVPNASINVTSTASISNTKIGTARIKSIAFDSSSNTANSSTYTYKTFLFDVNVNNSITGNVNTYTTGTSTIVSIGNTTAGQVYSTVDNAYKGAKLRITAGPGTGEAPKFITSHTGASGNLTLASAFTATLNSQSKFSIDFEFNDADSLATFSGTTKINAATIDNRSKDLTSTYLDTFISDSSYEPLIFPIGQAYVTPGTIADFSYTYRRLFENVSFSGVGATVDSTGLTVESGANLSSAVTDSSKLEKYQVVVTSVGTSPYTLYQTVPVANITAINTSTKTLTVAVANNMTANVIATIDYSLLSGSPAKTKTLVNPSSTIQTTSGEVINSSGVIVYASSGQTTIQANNIIRTPDILQSLYVPDVIELISVYDFNGGAVANTGYTDVTYKYALETGQKDSFYDHSSIKLKPGYSAPVGPIVVRYKAYSSTSGGGFFSADSYPTYGTIPTYATKSSGITYYLRDCLDFRPVRKAATAAIGTAVVFDVNPSTYGPKIPKYGSDILLDFSYYLPRIDKLVLNKNKYFEVVKGIPAVNPIVPSDKQDTMNLYMLTEPAYVANTSDVSVTYFNNRRYTMRDIGALDSRISNLEYYTSLSLLEQDAINMQDSTTTYSPNLQRFKNGIVVDSFKGHSVADVTALDYAASIDVTKQELRPTFNITSRALNFDSSNSSNYLTTGPFVTVTASNTAFVDQKLASKSLNINPFNVVNYIGKITLNPPSDTWVDITKKPDVTVNLGGDKDAWALIDSTFNNSSFAYEWGSWQTVWSGSTRSTEMIGNGAISWAQLAGVAGNAIKTTTTTTQSQTRSGIKTQIVPETITKSIGDRVVDVSIIPYMRAKSVLFVGTDFKPDTVMYPFFDGTPVEQYTVRANKFILAQNKLTYRTSVGNEESVTIYNNGTSSSLGTGVVVKSSNNSVFVVNLTPSSAFNVASANLIGSSTGSSVRISGYEHYSGFANTASSNTIRLAVDATGANNEILYGNTSGSNIISIVAGTGAGQQRTISSYVASTRTVTVSSTWTTTPDSSSVYSIGRLTTTRSGDVAGIFNIPASIFRVGEKQFRLIDSSTGDIPSSSTNGDASFFAQGLLETTENTIVSTIQPTIQRTSVGDTRVTSTTSTITTPIAGWWDPLAQTFLISPAQYSQGLFIEKVRVCFKSKHDSSPVTLQLRPVVNGYPSSTTVYPYGSVTLTPDKVNVTDSPSLDDATKYTDFVFDAPVYMLPGEHTFVLLSNSNGYEAYAAEMGKLDLVTNLQISEQPYGGSLFKSQNGSTWTADQNIDMMFRLYRKDFSTSTTATVKFLVDKPSSNVVFDLLNLTTSQIVLANTTVNYSFLSEKITGGTTDYYNINSNEDYAMTEGSGRRVLNPTSGNNTFILKATMTTNNPHISPVIDTTRFGGLFVENIINSLPLLNTGFSITTSGSGYTGNTSVTISGGGGSGANAYAVANVTTGNITSIVVDIGGTGYTTSPTITISAPPVTGGNTTSVVVYNGEDKKSGGNSVTRYMTRRVTLNDGFDSGDLRVYLTGYKPSGSNIYVYYKILSRSDSDTFDSKNYQLMTEIGNGNFVSLAKNDYRELVFAPGISGSANNSVTYTTDTSSFNSFKTFAIKIVMSGTNTTDVPKVRDVRAVALPAV